MFGFSFVSFLRNYNKTCKNQPNKNWLLFWEYDTLQNVFYFHVDFFAFVISWGHVKTVDNLHYYLNIGNFKRKIRNQVSYQKTRTKKWQFFITGHFFLFSSAMLLKESHWLSLFKADWNTLFWTSAISINVYLYFSLWIVIHLTLWSLNSFICFHFYDFIHLFSFHFSFPTCALFSSGAFAPWLFAVQFVYLLIHLFISFNLSQPVLASGCCYLFVFCPESVPLGRLLPPTCHDQTSERALTRGLAGGLAAPRSPRACLWVRVRIRANECEC